MIEDVCLVAPATTPLKVVEHIAAVTQAAIGAGCRGAYQDPCLGQDIHDHIRHA